MKEGIAVSALAMLMVLCAHVEARAAGAVEITVDELFVPSRGFDDNDDVVGVVAGTLPNSCWTLLGSRSERVSPNRIRLRQYARRKNDGTCRLPDRELPVSWRKPSPFMREVQLGRLNAGEYEWLQVRPGGNLIAAFKVDPAPVEGTDTYPYAPVSNAFVPDGVLEGQLPILTLTGELTLTCLDLVNDPEVSLTGNVIVVLPKLTAEVGLCYPSPRSYLREVPLPAALQPGHYMVHVRAANGLALNRLFWIRKGE